MGWDDVRRPTDEMTEAQRSMIISLREQHDGASPGAYVGDHLPELTKIDASAMIRKLQEKIERKNGKGKEKPCMGCFAGVTNHDCTKKSPRK